MSARVAEGLFRLRLSRSNAFLINDGDLTLVDAGMRREAGAIRNGVRDAGLAPGEIDRVLLTHYDVDHVGALASLASDLDAKAYLGAPDAAFLRGDRTPPLSNHKGILQRALRWLAPTPDLPVRGVDDGERIGGFRAYLTPGHTPGHTVYVNRSMGAAFLGDIVATRRGEFVAVRRLSNYDAAENARSVRAFAECAPPFEVACPGHGRPIVEDARARLREFVAAALPRAGTP